MPLKWKKRVNREYYQDHPRWGLDDFIYDSFFIPFLDKSDQWIISLKTILEVIYPTSDDTLSVERMFQLLSFIYFDGVPNWLTAYLS